MGDFARAWPLVRALALTPAGGFDVVALGHVGRVVTAGALASVLEVLSSYAQKEMAQALHDRSHVHFWGSARSFAGYCTVYGALWVFYQTLQDRLVLLWKRKLIDGCLRQYTSGLRFYHSVLQRQGNKRMINDVEQRIADDIAEFCRLTTRFTLKLLRYSVRAAGFFGILYKISPKMAISALLYSAFTTVAVQRLFGQQLVVLNDDKITLHARLRRLLMRLKENA
eukprot:Hpha_TRINITY_DN30762_c0_g1::TRINITY_DN30762_c0_g1_i1::g.28441::m.28441